jgi:DNA-binding beta-propeller fold protein YncE
MMAGMFTRTGNPEEAVMNRFTSILYATIVLAVGVAICSAQQPAGSGPYKVLKTARVGGEGNWDYIYADVAGRRLYIPRRGGGGPAPAGGAPAANPVPTRVTVFDLETLASVGEVPAVGGNGAVVDPKSGHGFTSSKPVSMFDTKTLQLVKTIEVGNAQPDGILFDASDERVYVFSHPTKDATVIDGKTGDMLGKIDLGGVPEEGVPDGKGTLYVVMQDPQGSVTVVDEKTMKATAHYPFGNQGNCNGLALDAKNKILFAACRADYPPSDPPKTNMVILSAKDGKILTTLPLAGASDGAMFNPATMEVFSTQGNGTLSVVKENSPTSFEVEQTLPTMNGARTIALDTKTGHIFTMSDERGPAPPPPPGGGRGGRAPAIPGSFTLLMIGK